MRLEAGNGSRWNPFKFLRRTPEEKRSATDSAGAMTAETGTWSDPSRLLTAEPFRVMHALLRDPLGGLGQPDRWFGDYSPNVVQPRVDVVDEGDALRITAELPGMDRNEVEVVVEDGALILRGEKKLESEAREQGCYRLERAFGSFERVIPLPDNADIDRAQATFDKGILSLSIPKIAEKEKPGAHRLEIK
jgi:HSP20 family protein